MNRPPRILVVEDQYFVAVDCEQQLQEAGYTCTGVASTREDAVRMAQCDPPDMVIMDIRLGGPGAHMDDGVSAAIEIFERLGVRCLFASAHADSRVRQGAERARPLGWLSKPYSAEALVHAVRDALHELDVSSPVNH